MLKDYYKILGISKDASNQEIKSAYRELAKKWHPDVCNEPNAHEKFIEISEAYEILKDPVKRQQYDQHFKYKQQVKQEKYSESDYQRNREYENTSTNKNYEAFRRAQEEARRKAQEYANTNIEDFMNTVLGVVFEVGKRAGKAVIYALEGEKKYAGSELSLFENFIIGLKGVLLLIAILLMVSLVGSPVGLPLGIMVSRSLWHNGRFVGIIPLIVNTIIVALILIIILIIVGINIIKTF